MTLLSVQTLTFNDAHIAMVLSRLEDDSEDLVDKHASSINNFVKFDFVNLFSHFIYNFI